MTKSVFSYLKLTALVLAIALIGLSGLSSVTTNAQENEKAPDRQIDLRAKLKDKKFTDGRRVTIETLDTGEKIVAEVKEGKFVKMFLVATDGTEVQGVVKTKRVTTTTTSTCSATITYTTTTHRLIRKDVVTSTSTIVQIPCPGLDSGDTFRE